jgi:hypothetical protein
MSWRECFRRQAKSDYELFKELNKTGKPVCHQMHYLQMATEKIAKAFLSSNNNIRPKFSHSALTRFMKISKGRPDIRRKLSFGNDMNAFVSYIDSIIPFAEHIENLAPAGGNGERINPEYPWQDPNGDVVSPLDNNFAHIHGDRTNMSKFMGYMENLIRVSI